jgi:hypothetical protein
MSPGINLLKCFAPTSTHKRVSFLIVSRITNQGGVLIVKDPMFCSFYNFHMVSKVRKARALR